MLASPSELLGRDLEWEALTRFVERDQRLAVVYGPRRVGKSFLIDALCAAAGGRRYQAITGVSAGQVADFGRQLGEWLGAGPLDLDGWADALERLTRVDLPFVALDELPYLIEAAPELPGLLQRYVDDGSGPALILSGSDLSVMSDLVDGRAPLYGRAGTIVVPAPLTGADLAHLWDADPLSALWVDATLGGLPGYRPLVSPPGRRRDRWMAQEVLAPGSPLLDAAAADLADVAEPPALRGIYRAILAAIASGERAFGAISRVAGVPTGALTRPLAALRHAGLVERIPDPLRSRRDRYELSDPHLRFWLAVIAPNRSRLQAGSGVELWDSLRETTWPSQVLGPRWEAVVRRHIADASNSIGPLDELGYTTIADRARGRGHEVDLAATRGGKLVLLGEAKLRRLGVDDRDRLLALRDVAGAPEAKLVLASANGVAPAAANHPDVIALTPTDVYG